MSSPVIPSRPGGGIAVAFAMPDETFARVFTATDLAALRATRAIHLVSDRPLDLDDPADGDALAQTELLVTGWGTEPLDADRLDRLPRLQAVVHSAGSIRPVIADDAWARGLAVAASAAPNAIPVAEYTVAMIVLAAKRAFFGADAVRAGERIDLEARWPTIGMCGITVGVIGASRVGRAVIRRLQAFDVHVVVSDPYLDAEDAARLGVARVDLDGLPEISDIVTLHAPLIPATEGMLDRAFFERLRPGATFINTARGAIVDQEALIDRLERGDIAAVLDVTDPEHLPQESRLLRTPNTFITPHIAGSMGNELRRLADNAVRETIAYATTGEFLDPIMLGTVALQA